VQRTFSDVLADQPSDATTTDDREDPTASDDHDPESGAGRTPDSAQPRQELEPDPRQPGLLKRIVVYGVLPGLVMTLAVGAGVLKWRAETQSADQTAATESVRAATEATTAILSYGPDTVDRDLGAARSRLTGGFLDAYTSLTHDVVIPGAKEKKITATARVPAAASVTAGRDHAVVLVFVDQTTTVGADPPTDTSSCVRVTLDKRGDHWLISAFDPI
jgi:Mce-associated membrane protein